MSPLPLVSFFFFFNDTATTEIYTLSLHDALPIYLPPRPRDGPPGSGPCQDGAAVEGNRRLRPGGTWAAHGSQYSDGAAGAEKGRHEAGTGLKSQPGLNAARQEANRGKESETENAPRRGQALQGHCDGKDPAHAFW